MMNWDTRIWGRHTRKEMFEEEAKTKMVELTLKKT